MKTLLAFALMPLTGLSPITSHASVTLLDVGQGKDEWKVGFYGFAEMDAIFDTTRSLKETFGNAPVDRSGTFAGDNGRTQFSIRNSRLGFTLAAPKTGDWSTQGVMEFDFLGNDSGQTEASTYNNPTLRARHFYAKAESNGWSLLAGQYWTLFGWQPNYFLATLSVAPVSAVLYQRTAQVTALKSIELGNTQKLTAGLSLVRPAQRDGQVPGVDAGLRWEWKGRKSGFVGMTSGEAKAQPMSVGVSGRLNEFEYGGTGDTTTTTHLTGSAIAVDALLPILGSAEDSVGNTLTLTGEFSSGQGYSEAFPSFTGNLKPFVSATTSGGSGTSGTNLNADAGQIGLDPVNGLALVHLTTFNLQLQYHLPQELKTFVTAGYGQLYSNNIDPLTGNASGTIYDRQETAFFNVGHNCTQQFRVAGEFDFVRTTYSDGVASNDKRFQVSTFFYF